MNRNQNDRFAYNPTNVDIQRSRFDRPSDLKTSFNAGELIPIYIDEVLPGDTFQMRSSKLVRMSTLAAPIMDNIFLDTYFFYVPHRLVWDHWKNLNGENDNSPWFDSTVYSVPTVGTRQGHYFPVGSIADYMGVPTGINEIKVSALPFRSYAKIWNDWFRDENLQTPAVVRTDDTNRLNYGENDNGMLSFLTDSASNGLHLAPVAKYHDYFTSALPSPQKGPDVTLPLGLEAPVLTNYGRWDINRYPDSPVSGEKNGLLWYSTSGGTSLENPRSLAVDTLLQTKTFSAGSDQGSVQYMPANLYADLSQATAASINQLRFAFQLQKMYEKDARGGTRYIEMIKSHFGVTSPDARLQRSEYLGGNRIPININQVVQNSETGTTPQGNTTAYSLTVDTNNDFTKSFTEHGYVIGVCCVRYRHTYQQGLEKLWSRKQRTDFYLPVFANIGEQPILNKEIYMQGTSADDEVFGYQEAWAEYRYKPSRTSGMMRSQYAQSLDVWHLGDNYNALPTLSSTWIAEDKSNIDRALAVTSAVSHQFIADFHFDCRCTRPMPLYSIPGLIDHH